MTVLAILVAVWASSALAMTAIYVRAARRQPAPKGRIQPRTVLKEWS